MASDDSAASVTEQIANAGVAVALIGRDARECTPEIMRARIVDARGVEECRNRFFKISTAGPCAIRKNPLLGRPRYGPQKFERRTSKGADGASSFSPFEPHARSCPINLGPPKAAGFFSAHPR
jgi:hypothetical protein